MGKKVSIIVPVYNTASWLSKCVESIRKQTYTDIEIILINDGSSDNSGEICDEYAQIDKRIRVIHQHNQGANVSRKEGLRIATGEYVMFLDSDDWIDYETVENTMLMAEKSNAGCVMFSYFKEYENKSIPVYIFNESFAYNQIESEAYVHQKLVGFSNDELVKPHRIDTLSSMCCKLYKKNIVKKGKFFSERIVGTSEDTLFNLYVLDGCDVAYVHKCFYHYRKTNVNSITTMYKQDLAEKWDVMYRYFEEYIEQSGKKETYYPRFLNRVACGMIGLGLNEINDRSSRLIISKKLKKILQKELYTKAFRELDYSYCPIQWKIFFELCIRQWTYLLVLLLGIINFLRNKVKG